MHVTLDVTVVVCFICFCFCFVFCFLLVGFLGCIDFGLFCVLFGYYICLVYFVCLFFVVGFFAGIVCLVWGFWGVVLFWFGLGVFCCGFLWCVYLMEVVGGDRITNM